MNKEEIKERYEELVERITFPYQFKINELEQENKELHNKIDKAIDLLENCGDYYEGDFESMKFQYDVIKILKGASKEN